MKIALFCPNYPPAVSEGGISHYTRRLARQLSDGGGDVCIVAGSPYCGSGEEDKIRVYKYGGNWNLAAIRRMSHQLSSEKVDLINLQYSPVMYRPQFKIAWTYLAKRFVSTVSLHTLWGGLLLNKLFAINILTSATGVIATNSEILYLLKKYLPIYLKKTCHIPIGPNITPPTSEKEDQKKILAKYSIDPDVPVLSYFGMSYPGKGLQTALRTAGLLSSRYNLDVKLLVIGGGESDVLEYVQDNKKLVRELGMQERVTFTGQIPAEEVSVLLNSSTAVILPFTAGVSDRRGSLMAALAHHKAIITTKPPIAISGFKNEENMLWPEQRSADALAETARQVLQEPLVRRKLENGAKKLARRYRWEDIAENTRQFFQNLIANERSPKIEFGG